MRRAFGSRSLRAPCSPHRQGCSMHLFWGEIDDREKPDRRSARNSLPGILLQHHPPRVDRLLRFVVRRVPRRSNRGGPFEREKRVRIGLATGTIDHLPDADSEDGISFLFKECGHFARTLKMPPLPWDAVLLEDFQLRLAAKSWRCTVPVANFVASRISPRREVGPMEAIGIAHHDRFL